MKRFLQCSAAVLAALWLLTMTALASGEVVGALSSAPQPLAKSAPLREECELGSTVADALKAATGADAALVTGGDLVGDLAEGLVRQADIAQVFAADEPLAVAMLTPAALWEMLEWSVHAIVVDPNTETVVEEASDFGGFCHVSGLKLVYDASAPAGERVQSITLDDGRKLDKMDGNTVLRVCAAESLFAGAYDYPVHPAEIANDTLCSALGAYVAAHRTLPVSDAVRIVALGARENALSGLIPRWALLAGAAVLIVLIAVPGRKLARYRDEFEENEEKWAWGYRKRGRRG